MKKLFPLSLFFCWSCGEATPPLQKFPEPERIEAVERRSDGGDMGYASWLRITRDSVLYWNNTVMSPENDDSFRRANTPEAWQALTADLNLDSFRAAAGGQSVQPVDGIDTEIVVFTNKDTIAKTNAARSPEWNRLLMKTQLLPDK